MISIKITQYKEFQKRARAIHAASVLPILSYIKLDCVGTSGILSKTNLQSHVWHEIEAEFSKNCTVLLDENLMTAFCSATDQETIQISWKEITVKVEKEKVSKLEVTLTDGKKKTTFQAPAVSEFPKQPEIVPGTASYELTQELLEWINVATNFIVPNRFYDTFVNCVHLSQDDGKLEIMSTDKVIMLVKKMQSTIPSSVFVKEICDILSDYTHVVYITTEKVDFFICGLTTYTFTKGDVKTPPYKFIFDGYKDDGGFFISRSELISFCKLVVAINPLKKEAPCVHLSDNGADSVKMKFSNKEYVLNLESDFAVTKDITLAPFQFNANLMFSAIDGLPHEKIRLTPYKNAYVVTSPDDDTFFALIQGIVSQPNNK